MLFLVVLTLVGSTLSVKIPKCCVSEKDILSDNGTVCIDSVTNVETPLSLEECYDKFLITASEYNHSIAENGALYLTINEVPIEIDAGTFCFANGTFNITDNVLVICSAADYDNSDADVLGYSMLVSSVFLLITVIVYCILPEIRDLQGKSIINFCISLGCGLCILGFMKITEFSDLNLCAVRAFFTYFFVVASFFWSNAISIQIFLCIRRPTVPDYGWKMFLWFALYAWGCPALMTIAMAIVNYHPGNHSKPGIGLNSCWFYNIKQQWYYMYSVISILIVINILLFLYLSVYLWRHTFSSTHVKALRYKFVMTLRLFVIMGIPWIFEMISTFFKASTVWSILDIVNALQGPLIFLVLVVLRRRVIKALFKRGYLDCISGVIERFLAVGDDDEEVIEHTVDVPLDNKN